MNFGEIFKNTFFTEHLRAFSTIMPNVKKYQEDLLQNLPPEVFCKKGVLRDFTKLTGKQLCRRLFFNKVADRRPAN